MTRGEEIGLLAMQKELKSLSKKVTKAKSKTELCMGAASTICQCRIDAGKILRSDMTSRVQMELIKALADKEKVAFKNGKLNLIKLMDKESDLMLERDSLQHEVSRLEFRYSMRN